MKQFIYLSFFFSLFLYGCSNDNNFVSKENMHQRDIIVTMLFCIIKIR